MSGLTRRGVLASVAAGAAGGVAAASPGAAVTGWREALVIVPDLDPWIETLVAVGGWEVLTRGDPETSLNSFWRLPQGGRVEQAVMRNRGETSGFIRLVKATGFAQQRIRPDDQAWETGGVAALDLRVIDIDAARSALHARGWRAPSDPVRYEAYRGIEVIQWAPASPDGVRLSLIQRISPPLVGWPALKRWSRAINAAVVVKSLDAPAKLFGQTLGLPIGGRSEAVGANGPNVMGLPWAFQRRISTQIVGFRSTGDDGSVELICIPDAQGRDYSIGAHPPNLGLAGLRFMVNDVHALASDLQRAGRPLSARVQPLRIEPYGACLACAVRTGDGVWLEFVQRSA